MIAIAPIKTSGSGKTDPDAQLMLRAGGGDEAAFDSLVERYYDRVLFVIGHLMGDNRQADDLAQEVFLRVYRARASYQPQSKFSTWLFVIVNNVVRNARRSLARRREVPSSRITARTEAGPGNPIDDHRLLRPADATLRGELRETVRHAIDDLQGRQRTAILLYHFRGFSYAEIADEMDTTLCAAKALLHRARGSLRDQLTRYVRT